MQSNINPADSLVAVTPSDSTALKLTSGIYVGSDGDLAVTDNLGVVTTLVGVKAGNVYPIRVKKVMSTNTTATGIVAMYNLT